MGTIAEKLTYLNATKTAIKNAIIGKGVSVSDSDTFRSYAQKIGAIETGGSTVVTGTTPPTGGSDGDKYIQQFYGGALTSDGNCYIDTGLKPNSCSRAITEFKLTAKNDTYDTIFGTRSNSYGRFTARFSDSSSGVLSFQKSSNPQTAYISYNSIISKNDAYDDYQKIELAALVRLNNNPNYIFGSGISGTNPASFDYNLFLFANNDAGSAGDYANASIKYFKLYNAYNTLIQFLVPVENNGVACMYDMVTGQYFLNQGSGSFTYTAGNMTDGLLWRKVNGSWEIAGVLL